MARPPGWEEAKLRAWRRLWEDLEIGYLDTDILEVLVELFARPGAYPVSSCSGRVVVVDAEYPWERDDTNLVFKKHGPVTAAELEAVASRPFLRRLWLSVQGPIYHVYAADLGEALELLGVARRAGFKHSGVLSCGPSGCVVELRTGVRMAAPIAERGGPRLDRRLLEWLAGVANAVLAEAKARNARLLEELRRARPPNPWGPAARALEELRAGRRANG